MFVKLIRDKQMISTKMKIVVFVVLIFGFLSGNAKDSLSLTIKRADSIFIKNNLMLLAAQFNIQASKALKIQAKLYPNPNIYVEQSLINKYTRANYDKDSTKTGNTETIVQIQQLILLAGKRNKQIRIADINAKLTETEFENILRTLRLQLHTDLAELFYNLSALKLLKEEQESIAILSSSLESNTLNGFISTNEIVRIKSLLLEVSKDVNEYRNRNFYLQAELNTLLNISAETSIKPLLSEAIELRNMNLVTVIDSAKVYNPDLKTSNYLVELAQAQYNLSKAMAVPDPYVQLMYDKSGNYIRNYYGLGLGISLPVFNRNQGNIKVSKFSIDQNETKLKQQQLTVSAQIISTFSALDNNKDLLDKYRTNYEQQLLDLMDKVLESYKKRLISLVDFTNYYESYKQSYLSLLNIKTELLNNVEQINFLVGKPIISFN